jgi:hypothetical protein
VIVGWPVAPWRALQLRGAVSAGPADHPPPVDPVREFVAEPTDPEDYRVKMSVVIGGLSCRPSPDRRIVHRTGATPIRGWRRALAGAVLPAG